MIIRRPLLVSVLLVTAIHLWDAPTVSAYWGTTALDYDEESDWLSGYTRTYREPWDWDTSSACTWYDPEYGCVQYVAWSRMPAVVGTLYTPSEVLGPLYSAAWPVASINADIPDPEFGGWTASGDHYIAEDTSTYTYEEWCQCWWETYQGRTHYYFGTTSNQVNVGIPIPTGESTESSGWWSEGTSVHLWVQTLAGGNFGGRIVTEQDPGGGGPDTCWFPTSIIDPFDGVTGGSWQVGSDNRWGPDRVGYLPGAVEYYRNQGSAPCETQFQQTMLINRPGTTDVSYTTQLLRAGITYTTVWSERAGQYAERVWP